MMLQGYCRALTLSPSTPPCRVARRSLVRPAILLQNGTAKVDQRFQWISCLLVRVGIQPAQPGECDLQSCRAVVYEIR